MRIRWKSPRAILVIVIAIAVSGSGARADGGALRMRRAAGRFEISLFTASETLAAGDADLSVLLQDRATGDAILDADVTIRLTPDDGTAGASIAAVATHREATNKLLYAALVNFPRAGDWRARVSVGRGSDSASVECQLPVTAATSRSRVDVLIHLLVVLILVLLFILHQWLFSRDIAGSIVAVNET